MVGGVEAGGEGGAQADMTGCGSHHGQHDGWIQVADLAAAPDVGVVAAAMQVIQPEQIGEETRVELRRLQRAGDVLVAAGVQDIVQRRLRMAPPANVQRSGPRLEVGDQVHLPLRHALDGGDGSGWGTDGAR